MRKLLTDAVERGATDVHIRAGDVVYARIGGELVPLDTTALSARDTLEMTRHILATSSSVPPLEQLHDHTGPWSAPGIGRFRVSLLKQRSSYMIVLRIIPDVLPTIESLGLPPALASIALAESGVVLVAGAPSSGRASTVAALVHHLNSTSPRRRHVVTIESSLRYLHRNQKCAVTQREIGVDTDSYFGGVKAALEQDADVIAIGDLGTPELVELSLRAAEQGRLVIGRVRATDTTTAIRSFLANFEVDRRDSARLQLSDLLRGVVAQRLLPRADRRGRVVAAELLLMTPVVRNLLTEGGRLAELRDTLMEERAEHGTQTFDQHLADLVIAGHVAFEVAVTLATNSLDFELQLRGLQH